MFILLQVMAIDQFFCPYLSLDPGVCAELDNETKITKLLVSAYPQSAYMMAAEFSSDNLDDYSATNPISEGILEEVFRWEDDTEVGKDGPNRVCETAYLAKSSANEAL